MLPLSKFILTGTKSHNSGEALLNLHTHSRKHCAKTPGLQIFDIFLTRKMYNYRTWYFHYFKLEKKLVTNRFFCRKTLNIKGNTRTKLNVNWGVPHRSVLGSILYLLNKIPVGGIIIQLLDETQQNIVIYQWRADQLFADAEGRGK